MKQLLLFPFIALFAVSCASNTPTSRIEKNPRIFSSLSEEHKALVEVGQIKDGMSPKAVFLAWGDPDSRSQGQKKGKTYEQWNYNGLRPVMHQGFIGGGFGRFGGWGGPGWGPGWGGGFGNGIGFFPGGGLATDVVFLPYTAAWVKFQNNRVESWQRGRVR